MHNSRTITYPSITICPRDNFNFFVGKGLGSCEDLGLCDMGQKLNLSNMINYVQYYKVNETG